MITTMCIITLYVIPAIITWKLSRKHAIIASYKPDNKDVVRTLFPILNIFAIFIVYQWICEELPGKRSAVEIFFAIKPENYWKKEGEE